MSIRTKLVAAAAVLALGAGAAQAQDKLKVGFIYVGPVGDHGWTYQHNEGRLALEKKFGDKIDTRSWRAFLKALTPNARLNGWRATATN